MFFLCLWEYLINLCYLCFLLFFLPTIMFPRFLTMFPCSDIFEILNVYPIFTIIWILFYWFYEFRIFSRISFFFSIQNTWKNHPTSQFHWFLTIFTFSDIFEISYEYSLNVWTLFFRVWVMIFAFFLVFWISDFLVELSSFF